MFESDGFIYAGASAQKLGTWQANRWYCVRAQVNRTAQTMSVSIDGVSLGQVSTGTDVGSVTHFDVASLVGGSVYFDDLAISAQ